MSTLEERYVVDSQGNKTAVIITLRPYDQFIADLYDLAIVGERREEEPISLEEIKQRLEGKWGALMWIAGAPGHNSREQSYEAWRSGDEYAYANRS